MSNLREQVEAFETTIGGRVEAVAISRRQERFGVLDWQRPVRPIDRDDFEASSLDQGTHPIEVGVCRWETPAAAIQGWGTLIRPTPECRERGSSWQSSENIHGIRREELEDGMEAADAVAVLNAVVGGRAASRDGGGSDLAWAMQLVRAAGVRLVFSLGDFDQLALRLSHAGYMRPVRWLERARRRRSAHEGVRAGTGNRARDVEDD